MRSTTYHSGSTTPWCTVPNVPTVPQQASYSMTSLSPRWTPKTPPRTNSSSKATPTEPGNDPNILDTSSSRRGHAHRHHRNQAPRSHPTAAQRRCVRFRATRDEGHRSAPSTQTLTSPSHPLRTSSNRSLLPRSGESGRAPAGDINREGLAEDPIGSAG